MRQAGKSIRVKGLVQGVGFRPFVWWLARELEITGHVLNDGAGVRIEVFGPEKVLERFLVRLTAGPPPLARVDSLDIVDIETASVPNNFQILESGEGVVATGVVPDAATCPACLADIGNRSNRHHGYAFTNCTHCGPRLSILRHIPYDRASTSMSGFAMCPSCRAEYEDPADRRFHAQPVACPDCGPRLWFEGTDGCEAEGDPVTLAAERLQAGDILAVKGLGGFQVAVDAGNEAAVRTLRQRKRRPDKPLALMARDLGQIRRYCRVSDEEAEVLASAAAPIVLLETAGRALAEGIAPGQGRLGVMLANTPLHHLLLAKLDRPIVMTSGNLSENPQETQNAGARLRLAEIVDGFLMHDREIVNRLDDSVLRLDRSGVSMLRRARGYAPASVRLAPDFERAPRVLAMGGELKSAFCLINGCDAVLSQHLGDLENAPTFADYKKTLRLYLDLYQFTPEVIAVDGHPQYLSSVYGEELAAEFGADLVRVQHHHAHLASCLAERGWALAGEHPVYGVILDGLGWGEDGTVWGGEILKGGFEDFQRPGYFLPVPLPGGAAAMREPWRNLAAYLRTAFGPDFRDRLAGLPVAAALEEKNLAMLEQMMERSLNAPPSSSAGRLFDAVAAMLGISFHRQSFEGQAAMALESLARPFVQDESGYSVDFLSSPLRFSFAPLWQELIADLHAGLERGRIAARFHLGLIGGLAEGLSRCGARPGDAVVLSGGVFQNAILKDGLTDRLNAMGFRAVNHKTVPANDGGLALGQGVIAAARSVAGGN
ncbi:carbamoyltransferase HypF [uncultured Roseibium sp.]|uniref:carbamoyltransferase HypF n=1 Tax=uncultured Roseibium sp. TaxID=1936171 RepID=UPI00260EC2F4|nr:carbamoyltransferase HypF [uncultured Roseibium sp.]